MTKKSGMNDSPASRKITALTVIFSGCFAVVMQQNRLQNQGLYLQAPCFNKAAVLLHQPKCSFHFWFESLQCEESNFHLKRPKIFTKFASTHSSGASWRAFVKVATLELRVVKVVQVIEGPDAVAVAEQAFANVRANEFRAAGDEKIHAVTLTTRAEGVEFMK